jgi:hypothetical protein
MPRSDEEQLLNLVPEDGTAIGNAALKRKFDDVRGAESSLDEYAALRDLLVERGWLVEGAGRGGSVKRHLSRVRTACMRHAPDELSPGADLVSDPMTEWVEEAERRYAAYWRGEIEAVDSDVVHARLRAMLDAMALRNGGR